MKAENIEFIALFEASGWSQAYAAKRLRLTSATISRYLSADPDKQITPQPGTNELFKMILATEKPGALSAGELKEESLANWEMKVVEDLRRLHAEDRDSVIAVMRTMIHRLPKRPSVKYKLSSVQKHSGGSVPLPAPMIETPPARESIPVGHPKKIPLHPEIEAHDANERARLTKGKKHTGPEPPAPADQAPSGPRPKSS